MDACVTYYTKITQNDIPVRQVNRYNFAQNPSEDVINPCNTWICDGAATEYDCMGITYTPGVTGATGITIITGYTSSYKSLTDWYNTWIDGSCLNLFQNIVRGYGSNQSVEAFSSSNFALVQEDFNFMFSRYFNHDASTRYGFTGPTGATGTNPCDDISLPTYGITGDFYQNVGKFSNADNNCNVYINGTYGITPPGQQGYNAFTDILFDACFNMPGVCSQTQEYMCNACDREQIYANTELIKFCGCSSVATTGDTFYNDTLQNFDPVCDPLCNRLDTIKYNNPVTGVTQKCNANVCVIDNVVINSIASNGIVPSFNQVCPACADGQGNCICVIDATFNTTIPAVKGENGEGALNTAPKFTQYCPNSQCFRINPQTNQYESVQCTDTLPKGTSPDVVIPWTFAIICLVVLIFFVLIILAYKYQSDNTPIYKLQDKFYYY